MAESCLVYYITDRRAFPGDEPTRRHSLLDKIAEAARARVDYIQLREKDLSPRELEQLAREAMKAIREAQPPATGNRQLTTALLINSRTDVALAAGADGVHLRSNDVYPHDVRKIWLCGAGTPFDKLRAGSAHEPLPGKLTIAVSCHSPEEVAQAAADSARFAVFGPVFEKKDSPGTRAAGLAGLKEACRTGFPVLALGGITLENAQSCIDVGAAGIAAIRLFQDNDVARVVEQLRGLIPSTSRASSKPA
jgi:thiamine-phosphate pyrophosphorylase